MKLFTRINKFFRISREERSLFFHSLCLLFIWKVRIVFLPMPAYVKAFGQKGAEEIDIVESQDHFIRKVQSAVQRADSILPWKSKCLTEAIATKRLLEKFNLRSTLILGVAKDESQKLIAHAWLKRGNKIISGERGHEKFTVVQKFS